MKIKNKKLSKKKQVKKILKEKKKEILKKVYAASQAATATMQPGLGGCMASCCTDSF